MESLEVTIFNAAHQAHNKLDFYATILGIVSAFSQEHIGTANTQTMLHALADSLTDDTQH